MKVNTMRALSVSEAKMKLSGLIDAVNATDEEVVITKNGRPAAVLVGPEEFDSLKGTVAVRSDLGVCRSTSQNPICGGTKTIERFMTWLLARSCARSIQLCFSSIVIMRGTPTGS